MYPEKNTKKHKFPRSKCQWETERHENVINSFRFAQILMTATCFLFFSFDFFLRILLLWFFSLFKSNEPLSSVKRQWIFSCFYFPSKMEFYFRVAIFFFFFVKPMIFLSIIFLTLKSRSRRLITQIFDLHELFAPLVHFLNFKRPIFWKKLRLIYYRKEF